MSKRTPKFRVGVRSTHRPSRIEQLRFGTSGYGCKRGDFRLDLDRMPVDLFMREMARKWSQQ